MGLAEFGKLIKTARRKRQWTQQHLADTSGVGRRTVLRYEKGQIDNPEPEVISAVIDALGVSREDAFQALGWLSEEDQPAGAKREASYPADLRDDNERHLWTLKMPEEERWLLIDVYRARLEAARRRDAS